MMSVKNGDEGIRASKLRHRFAPRLNRSTCTATDEQRCAQARSAPQALRVHRLDDGNSENWRP